MDFLAKLLSGAMMAQFPATYLRDSRVNELTSTGTTHWAIQISDTGNWSSSLGIL